jgi:formylmethanofuran dehydrogenase subunit E
LEDKEFDDLLKESAKLRGHMCLGLPLGVKMGRLGLKLVGMEDPAKRGSLVVFVENDKCPVDGIQVTTGCSAGSGRLKMLDYGKSAATFVDGRTGRGFRVSTKQDFQRQAFRLGVRDGIVKPDEKVVPFSKLDREIVMNAFMKLSMDELLEYRAVKVKWNKPLMPNRTAPTAFCDECGDEIMDGKGIPRGAKILCGSCAEGAYYSTKRG